MSSKPTALDFYADVMHWSRILMQVIYWTLQVTKTSLYLFCAWNICLSIVSPDLGGQDKLILVLVNILILGGFGVLIHRLLVFPLNGLLKGSITEI